MAKLSGLQLELETIIARNPAKPREELARDLVSYLARVAPLGAAYENDLDECVGCNGYPPDGSMWCEGCQAKRIGMPHYDPRLSGLPVAEQLVAAEFLNLHHAWETEFEACCGDGELTLLWRNPNRVREPLADWDSIARFEFTEGYGWGAFCRDKVPEAERAIKTAYSEDAVRWNGSRAQLRYLPEFAAFVKRFVPGEVANG